MSSEASAGAPPRLLVYLHGHGSSPALVHPYYREHRDDGLVRLCPQGPVPADGAWAWFADGVRGADAVSLARTVSTLTGLVTAAAAEVGVGTDAVVLGGFSQGAATALAVAAELGRRGAEPLAGLLLQAGFVVEVDGPAVAVEAVAARSVLVQHPADDDVVPAFMGKDTAALLATAPAVDDVELELVTGGHVMSDEMLGGAQAWLAAR